jgi:hypothetical protein
MLCKHKLLLKSFFSQIVRVVSYFGTNQSTPNQKNYNWIFRVTNANMFVPESEKRSIHDCLEHFQFAINHQTQHQLNVVVDVVVSFRKNITIEAIAGGNKEINQNLLSIVVTAKGYDRRHNS